MPYLRKGLLPGGRTSWSWLGGYLVVAWVILQVTETLASLIGLPLWFGKAVLALLGAGLVVVVLTAALQGRGGARPLREPGSRGLLRPLTGRRTLALGVLAFAFLGLGTAGHMAARALGVGPAGTLVARGLLPRDAELVLADFEDQTGEPGLARAAMQALRVHLSQSSALRLTSPARIGEVLALMEAAPDAPLDVARAREIAIREGLKAVIAGEVHRLGSRYTVSARLIGAESGSELVAVLETADGPDELIPAVERLSLRLRERIGESLGSVRRSEPLSRVRTASLAALKSYTEGADANSRGDFERCALLMEEAIALDSTFAMALAGRAACNQNLGRESALQVSDRMRAYRMRERMTEEERLRFTAIYHQFVTEDRKLALEAWQAYDARFPERTSALFSMANLYAEMRRWAEAETLLRRGLELDPSSIVVLINLAGYQAYQGKWAEAEASLDSLAAQVPQLNLSWRRGGLSLAAGDWAAARHHLLEARESARGSPATRALVATLQARLARTRGRSAEAAALLREALAARLEAGDIENYHLTAVELADLLLVAWGDTAAALAAIDEALALHPLDSLDPLERSHLSFAAMLSRAGRMARARAHVTAWRRDVAPVLPGTTLPHWFHAGFAEAEARWSDAIAAWRLEDETQEDPLPALAHIGHAFDRLGQRDSALAYYQRYLATPSRTRHESDPRWRGQVLERLARLHDERGEHTDAARHYALLTELWEEGDATVQPRLEAARARLMALARER
ncbi:MAG TPA: hypothetical protein VK939_18225 [Longimicrobiales bacterium]|nr:hypothetical protein [Longimicrobiales bacterium]